jgi:hypothetical protein
MPMIKKLKGILTNGKNPVIFRDAVLKYIKESLHFVFADPRFTANQVEMPAASNAELPSELAMNYPIPRTIREMCALQQLPVDEELVASAIVGAIAVSQQQGKTLEELSAEILVDDNLLDSSQRHWLSEMLAQAWEMLSLDSNQFLAN